MLASIILTSILHFYFADSFRQDTGIKVYEQTKQPARRVVAEALVQAPVAKFGGNELTYDSLLIFMNHPNGLAAFNK